MRRGFIISSVVLVVLLAAAVVSSRTPRSVSQPIAFNHSKHVEEVGAECTDCHLYAESGLRATIPNQTLCSDCHSDALTDSEEELRLIEFIESGEKIPWKKVYWVPDHVFFSHRRHTAVAGIECERCHGEIGARSEPVSRPLLPLTMKRCMACHEEAGVTNDCIACHR